MVESLRAHIQGLLAASWQKLGLQGQLADIEIKGSDRAEFGDFSSNIALVGAQQAKMPPRKLAERLVAGLPEAVFSRAEIAGPGFVNLFLRPDVIQSQLREILNAGDAFGRVAQSKPTRIQIEFVSSNPTGPLTVGHGRQAVLGDVLARLYERMGYTVEREYYYNDEGRQIDLLAESLWMRYRELFGESHEIPEDGYRGEYLIPIANEMKQNLQRVFPQFDDEARTVFRREAVSSMKAEIEGDLHKLGVWFNHWFSEADLHKPQKGDDPRSFVQRTLDTLRDRNGVYEKDGAVWLAAEDHGGIKDSVLIRGDGRPTYLMVDIAYHMDKHSRGFEHVINVQGADHQVEQSSMKAAMRILGYREDCLDYAMHQFVSIKEGESAARMSTRAGRFILLRDLVEELGRDVVRYFMVARKPESHLEFDLELARAQSMDNPVYYIQYAHTRIFSIFRKAGVLDLNPAEIDLSALEAPEELDLIKRLDRLPDVVKEAALGFAPHLLAGYALDLARAFHPYYTEYRVIGTDEKVMWARLSLLRGVQTVLRNCLEILGMSVPEAM